MESESLSIGSRIRILRKSQKRNIQDIADACGLSKSMISKIETNAVMPSVATLVKIARALGTNVSVLMEERNVQTSEVTPMQKALDNLTQTNKGYHIYPFASAIQDKKMQPFLFVANKGEVVEHHLTHEGEEYMYVLEGEMKLQVGNIEYRLQQGDSVYFNAMEEHGIMPITDTVKYLNIFV